MVTSSLPNTKSKLWAVDPKGIHFVQDLASSGSIALSPTPYKIYMVHPDHGGSRITWVTLNEDNNTKKRTELCEVLRSLLRSRDFFYDEEALLEVIEAYDGLDYPDEVTKSVVVHRRLNLLYLAVLANSPKALEAALDRFGYFSVYFDERNFDPIDTAIRLQFKQILDAFADYFEENPQQFDTYLNKNRYLEGMRGLSHKYKDLLMARFMLNCSPAEANTLTEYPLSFPKESERCFEVFKSDNQVFDIVLQARIEEKAAKLHSRMIGRQDDLAVRQLITRFPINPSIANKQTKEIVNMIYDQNSEIILGDMKYLLRYIWDKNFGLLLFFSLLRWLCFIFFTLDVIWFHTSAVLGFISIALAVVQLIVKLLGTERGLLHWSLQILNLVDVYYLLAIPVIVVLDYREVLDDHIPWVNTWMNVTILIAGFKALAEFRMIDSVRWIIAMLTESFFKLKGFALVLLSTITFFAIIRVNLSKTLEEETFGLNEFLLAIDYYYNVSFGSWDNPNSHNLAQVVEYLLSGIFLALVMLNLLISVVSVTYEEFLEVRDLIDLRDINLILVQNANFFDNIRCLGSFAKKRGHRLCFVVPREDENQDDRIEGKLDGLKEMMGNIDEKIDSLSGGGARGNNSGVFLG